MGREKALALVKPPSDLYVAGRDATFWPNLDLVWPHARVPEKDFV